MGMVVFFDDASPSCRCQRKKRARTIYE